MPLLYPAPGQTPINPYTGLPWPAEGLYVALPSSVVKAIGKGNLVRSSKQPSGGIIVSSKPGFSASIPWGGTAWPAAGLYMVVDPAIFDLIDTGKITESKPSTVIVAPPPVDPGPVVTVRPMSANSFGLGRASCSPSSVGGTIGPLSVATSGTTASTILTLTSTPNPSTIGSIPPEMLTGTWRFTWTAPQASSAYASGDYCWFCIGGTDQSIYLHSDAGLTTLGVWTSYQVLAAPLSFAAGQTLTITVDMTAGGRITIAGASLGNGTTAFTGFTGWGSGNGTLQLGQYTPGTELIGGTFGNVQKLTVVGRMGTSSAVGTLTNSASSGGGGGGGVVVGNTATRPSYNTGNGFFVVGSRLFDANGNEFKLRGVNRIHFQNSEGGYETVYDLDNIHANACRMSINLTQSAASNIALVSGTNDSVGRSGTIAGKFVVIPASWNEGTTCSSDVATVRLSISRWVAQAAAWNAISRYSILNICNEWGPGNQNSAADLQVWTNEYINGIAAIRATGYTGCIMIDPPGCGQDNLWCLGGYGYSPNAAQALVNSDPQKNVIIGQHVYGFYESPPNITWQRNFATHVQDMANSGVCCCISEFGPGRSIGPSPTTLDPALVMQLAAQHTAGWLAWAADDWTMAGMMADDTWFSMTYDHSYTSDSSLTIFGQTVVNHPTLGTRAAAQYATVFNP